MANESEIFKIILKRGTTAKAQVYTGDAGEVVVDTGLKTLRVQDGVTPGGVLLAKSYHLHSFPSLENKPTTLSGYGITDAAPSSHIGATGAAHGVATTSVAGFMSATDKSKLDSITAGANTYTHPTSGATAGTYRSVTVDVNGHVTAGTNPTTLSGYGITDATPSSHVGATGAAHGVATTSVAGFMSATDKSKLDGVAAGANAYTHPTSGVTTGTYSSVTVNANGHVTAGTNPTTLTGYGITDAVALSDVVTVASANKLLKLDSTGKLPASVTGSATTLQTPRTINGVSFDGSANITINAADSIARIASSEKGAANGVATLDGTGKVPTSQLPSFVDDVLESPSFANLPTSGVTGVLYLTVDTNQVYRWSGTAYVEISAGAGTADSAMKLSTARSISMTGDVTWSISSFDGSANVTAVGTLANSGVTAGVYRSVTVDAKGRVTAGANPTTLSGYGITDAAPSSHVGATGAAHGVATTSVAGFMSATDKSKLDGVAAGANNYAHPTSSVTTGTYRSVTVDANGHVTAGTNPTTLNDYGIGDAVSSSDVVTVASANKLLKLDGTGKLPTSVTGSAATLQTARTINGVSFDGSANITINATDSVARVASSEKGAANGVATLDATGKVPASQLPSFVDDVLEFPSFTDLPVSGVMGVLYLTVDTNRVYRWSGSAYVEISAGTGTADSAMKLSTARSISMTGDVTWSIAAFDGSANVTATGTLANSGVTAGTYRSVTVDAKGRVTAGTNPTTLSSYGITDATPSSHVGATGAAHGVATTSVAGFMSATDKSKLDGVASGANNYTHPASGVAAGTYRSVTVDANGHVTAGTNPTTLSGYGITDAQPLHGDLTALAGLATTGLVVRTASGAAATRALSVSGTGLSLTNGDGVAGNIVITSNATSSNTASTVVARDASGGFSAGAVTVSGLGLSGTGGRITGNFSGAVFTDRTMFQTSTVNTATTLGSVPNGTGIGSSYVAFDKADPTNAAYLQLFVGSDVSSAGIRSGASGSGTPLPLKFLTGTGGVERVVIDAEGATAFKGGVFESKVALTAAAIDLKTGNMFTKTVTAATILSVVNAPASGAMASFILELTNGGAYAVTWWTGTGGATVKWAGGTAPSLTAAGRDVLGFYTHDGGVTWNGLVLGKDLK